jgi:predicted chitinase
MIPIYKSRTDITSENIKDKVKDENYNSGHLRVKSKYIRSSALFDVTYACRMGNGTVTSKEGSKFAGKGFFHITGKSGYEEVSKGWNELYNDNKEFHGKDIQLLETNIDVAIKASMVYWKMKSLNEYADKGTDQVSVDDVGKIVNGSGKTLPNGYSERRSYSKSAFENLK